MFASVRNYLGSVIWQRSSTTFPEHRPRHRGPFGVFLHLVAGSQAVERWGAGSILDLPTMPLTLAILSFPSGFSMLGPLF